MHPSILFLIDLMPARGGTEVHLCELSSRLVVHGFYPIVCNLSGDEPGLREVEDAGVEAWPREVARLYMPAGRAQMRRIIAEAADRNVRAVQTFHFKSDWMGVGVARALGCPLISSRRDMGFAQTPLRRLVYRSINRHVNRFIAPSRAVRDSVVRREGVSPDRIEVIYNGLDLGRFSAPQNKAEARAWLGLPPHGPVIGMVSGFRPIKDHPTLIRAMARLAAEQPDAHLALVGEGTEEEALRALANQLGLSDRVTFTGVQHDIPRVLAAIDVFVLSSHSEGMSNAIIEAMAAGLPVVATDVGGNAECVAHGDTGFIVPPGDGVAMAGRLLELLGHPGQAAAMGAFGRRRAEELFDVNAMVQRTADLYRALDAQRGTAYAVT